ncbi:MAG: hypothetical protein JNK85_22300 [Verrucomicrobiales bacterium]|nr:hypothetical protein [Verrucomicrobiales bacterium]
MRRIRASLRVLCATVLANASGQSLPDFPPPGETPAPIRAPTAAPSTGVAEAVLPAPAAPNPKNAKSPGGPQEDDLNIGRSRSTLASALPTAGWEGVEKSVDEALEWLAKQQGEDGDFRAPSPAQPAVTGLALLAFLSRGHRPGEGRYGARLDRAVDYLLQTQSETGLFTSAPVGSVHEDKTPSHTAAYNHAIAGTALCEVYGTTDRARADRIKGAVMRALDFTRQLQTRPKFHEVDRGGWRYVYLRWDRSAADSDLSVTGWQLMFLRSAQNAEFQVPVDRINAAVEYVERCFVPGQSVFNYALVGASDIRTSRGMVGAGILSLALAGRHHSEMARSAGEWLARRPFGDFGGIVGLRDRYFYSAYYCSQAMAQLGGSFWERFYPPLVRSLLSAQQADGSWPPEPAAGDAVFGNVLTTALAVLSLTPPYQLLPVYQR